jgi:NADH-quinone oxidoreductase subunit C
MSVLDEIKTIEGINVKVQRENRIFVDVKTDRLISVLYALKLIGFNQLSLLSAVDRINDGQFEIFYVLYNYKEKVNCVVRTFVSRENPEVETAALVYPPAHTYERELAEMFGIKVEGNEDAGKPFILENFKGDVQPLRKDFNSMKYVNAHFQPFRHHEDVNLEAKDE